MKYHEMPHGNLHVMSVTRINCMNMSIKRKCVGYNTRYLLVSIIVIVFTIMTIVLLVLLIFSSSPNSLCADEGEQEPKQEQEQERFYQNPPEQVHLSLGRNDAEMIVSWVSQGHEELESSVEVKKAGQEQLLNGIQKFDGFGYCFDAGTESKRYINVHHAKLTGLQSATDYLYKIKCRNQAGDLNETNWFPFQSFDRYSSSKRIAFFGDLGVTGKKDKAVAVKLLTNMVKDKMMDLVLHVGDFAYDLKSNEGKRGDHFFNMIQPIASRIPYQVVPGNHEQEKDFKYTQYNHRFNMIDSRSGATNNFYYSFNVGLIHVLALNSEYHADDEFEKMKKQYKFLEEDLIEANKNRESRPWIIVMMHHPLYCKQKKDKECRNYRQVKLMRKDTNLEELFYRHGVDVVVTGHDHVYKRTFPVFRNVICSSKSDKNNPYYQPRGPIHVTSGVAGRLAKFKKQPPFTAFGLEKNGVNLIHSVTPNTMTIDFIEANGNRADRIKIFNKNRVGRRYSCKEAEQESVKNYKK